MDKETSQTIVCAGHWVLDHIKIINAWPKKFEQCHILNETISGGGAPLNVALDLANLCNTKTIYGMGCIGTDAYSEHITDLCYSHNINMEYLRQIPAEPTSYTDVMVDNNTRERTLFHYGGANRHFTPELVPINELVARNVSLFYLGHLLVIKALDASDQQYGSVAARLLDRVQQANISTVVDIATDNTERYGQVVIPCLPYIDHLVINELEAWHITGIQTRKGENLIWEGVIQAAYELIKMGVNQNAVIHMPEGSYCLTAQNNGYIASALSIPKAYFQSTCGAGDAFCSGFITGLDLRWSLPDIIELAHATAAACITSKDNSDGIRGLAGTLRIAAKWRTSN